MKKNVQTNCYGSWIKYFCRKDNIQFTHFQHEMPVNYLKPVNICCTIALHATVIAQNIARSIFFLEKGLLSNLIKQSNRDFLPKHSRHDKFKFNQFAPFQPTLKTASVCVRLLTSHQLLKNSTHALGLLIFIPRLAQVKRSCIRSGASRKTITKCAYIVP